MHTAGSGPARRSGGDAAAESLLRIVATWPAEATPSSGLDWVRHPLAAPLYRWAAETLGDEVALRGAGAVAGRAHELAAGELDAAALVATLRGAARRWRAGRTRMACRSERFSVRLLEVAEESPKPAPFEPDPLEGLPDWLAVATGTVLAAPARLRLVVCATVAVDLAAGDERLRLGAPSPIGVVRRRLAAHLDPPLESPVARRSIARLLLGPTGKHDDVALERFARRQDPLGVPSAIRAGWAADLLDLEPERFAGRRRPVARDAARLSVLRHSLLFAADPAAGALLGGASEDGGLPASS